MSGLTPEERTEMEWLCEQSKDDNRCPVGSQFRWLVMLCRRLDAALYTPLQRLPVCGSEAWAVIRPEGTVELVSIRASERGAQWAIGNWNEMEAQGFRCTRILIAEHKL